MGPQGALAPCTPSPAVNTCTVTDTSHSPMQRTREHGECPKRPARCPHAAHAEWTEKRASAEDAWHVGYWLWVLTRGWGRGFLTAMTSHRITDSRDYKSRLRKPWLSSYSHLRVNSEATINLKFLDETQECTHAPFRVRLGNE